MLRTALRPRWLLLLLVVLVAVAGMARLGSWQLDRARQHSEAAQLEALHRPAVELRTVLRARRPFVNAAVDRPVTASGRWDETHQLLVAGRGPTTGSGGRSEADGAGAGWWVLTPLLLSDGSAVPVVRGWVDSPSASAALPSAVPAGPVRVSGILEPAEVAAQRLPGQGSGLPAGHVDRVAVTQLVQLWPYPLLTGYLLLATQQPPPRVPVPDPVRVVPVASGLALQNLSYAVQWFVFAGFGLFLWWRLVRDEHSGRGARAPAATAPPPVSDDGASASAVGGARS